MSIIPRFGNLKSIDNLFGVPQAGNLLWERLEELGAYRGTSIPTARTAGARSIGASILAAAITRFSLPTRRTSGMILTIRTGPPAFSQRLVTQIRQYGLACADGRVVKLGLGGEVPCAEERDFFAHCREPWCEPGRRE